MNTLIIDTTSNYLFLGLIFNNEKKYILEYNKNFHNKKVFVMIENLLLDCNVEIQSLNYVAVVTGPGSYTGIRLGVCIGNAIAFSNKLIKRIDINALSLIAPLNLDNYFTAILARENSYYFAEFNSGEIVNQGDMDINEIKSKNKFFIKDFGNINIDLYFNEALRLIEKNITVELIMPRYLKKSQAERLKNK